MEINFSCLQHQNGTKAGKKKKNTKQNTLLPQIHLSANQNYRGIGSVVSNLLYPFILYIF